VPVGLALLFLMAVAPALSWRKIDAGVLWHRLAIPAWIGVATVVLCVAFGIRGLAPLVGFGLGAFAAASALRSLVLAVMASRRRGAGAWRGLVGRANGGMVVHLGVVVLAMGLVAATSFAHRGEVAIRPSQTVTFDGHRLTFLGLRNVTTPSRTSSEAAVRIDGGAIFAPAVSQFGGANSVAVGTPAIDSGIFGDVYLTFDALGGGSGGVSGAQAFPSLAKGSVVIGVVVEPLIAWMWAGGLLIGIGGILALVPGGRRRPTEPTSAPPSRQSAAAGPPDGGAPDTSDDVVSGVPITTGR
jgi:cytochrome c-type biogenesis protein CcmF